MAGYVTQSRVLPFGGGSRTTSTINGTRSFRDPGQSLISPDRRQIQTTVSFRTGRGGKSGLDTEEDSLLRGGTAASVVKELRNQSRRQPRSSHDTGHTFSTVKSQIEASYHNLAWTYLGNKYGFVGPIYLVNALGAGYPTLPSTNASYYGPLAIKLTRPTNPNVNLAVALMELRKDGLPAIPGLRSLSSSGHPARKAANEYLNYEFGIRPFLSDVEATLDSVRNSSRILTQFERDSDKVVRRKWTFDPLKSSSITTTATDRILPIGGGPFNWSFLVGSASGNVSVNVTRVATTSVEVSFSGAYTYHLSVGSSFSEQLKGYEQKANRLFGVRITPETLWNVGPWSWLADWNYNIGTNISNAVAFQSDSLVLKYGYLMIHRTTRYDYHWQTLANTLVDGRPLSGKFSLSVESKDRLRAEPYGFSSNPSSYSDRQWAILGALGLSKAPRSLF
jgi:hypothetical protein